MLMLHTWPNRLCTGVQHTYTNPSYASVEMQQQHGDAPCPCTCTLPLYICCIHTLQEQKTQIWDGLAACMCAAICQQVTREGCPPPLPPTHTQQQL